MMTTLSRWLRGSRTHSPRAAGRKHCRLQLETLEDRCVPATAADWLDPTLGTGGVVTTPSVTWTTEPVLRAPTIDAAVRTDGKVMVIANGTPSGVLTGNFAVLRYNEDGTLDTTFSGDGIASTDFNGYVDRASAVAVVGNKTVVVGSAQRFSGGNYYTDFALVRYNDDGSLDTTFGNGGKVVTSFGTRVSSSAATVAVLADGKIVVGGSGNVVRYNSNGSLDTTFGSGGKVTLGLPTAQLGIQSDGRIVVADEVGSNFRAMRLTVNGTLDLTFGGGDGSVETPITSGAYTSTLAYVYDLAIDPNDRILLAGEAYMGAPDQGGTATDAVVVRFTSDGSLDTTFGGGDGILTADFVSLNGYVNQVAQAVALQADGQIVVAGFTGGIGGTDVRSFHNTLVMRFNGGDGSLDTSFGAGGRLELQIGPGGSGGLELAESNGKLIVAGVSGNTSSNPVNTLTLSRFIEDGPPLAVPPTLVVTRPSPVTAGQSFQFTVTVQDASGNTITDYEGTVQFSSSDPLALLPAAYTFTLGDQGTHDFTATLYSVGSKELIVSSPDAMRRRPIVVSAGTAVRIAISGPTSIKAKTAFSITVTAYDAYGNVATGYTGTVHFSSSDSGATLPADYTFTASDAGVHTFTGLKLTKQGTQSITVTAIAGIPPLTDLDDVLTINVT
ncbi:MAG: hypothetical protein FJ271_20000 [Planctomycetes bacterium]|nr:hypothetical protein [Planctomycetota bacterium]